MARLYFLLSQCPLKKKFSYPFYFSYPKFLQPKHTHRELWSRGVANESWHARFCGLVTLKFELRGRGEIGRLARDSQKWGHLLIACSAVLISYHLSMLLT